MKIKFLSKLILLIIFVVLELKYVSLIYLKHSIENSKLRNDSFYLNREIINDNIFNKLSEDKLYNSTYINSNNKLYTISTLKEDFNYSIKNNSQLMNNSIDNKNEKILNHYNETHLNNSSKYILIKDNILDITGINNNNHKQLIYPNRILTNDMLYDAVYSIDESNNYINNKYYDNKNLISINKNNDILYINNNYKNNNSKNSLNSKQININVDNKIKFNCIKELDEYSVSSKFMSKFNYKTNNSYFKFFYIIKELFDKLPSIDKNVSSYISNSDKIKFINLNKYKFNNTFNKSKSLFYDNQYKIDNYYDIVKGNIILVANEDISINQTIYSYSKKAQIFLSNKVIERIKSIIISCDYNITEEITKNINYIITTYIIIKDIQIILSSKESLTSIENINLLLFDLINVFNVLSNNNINSDLNIIVDKLRLLFPIMLDESEIKKQFKGSQIEDLLLKHKSQIIKEFEFLFKLKLFKINKDDILQNNKSDHINTFKILYIYIRSFILMFEESNKNIITKNSYLKQYLLKHNNKDDSTKKDTEYDSNVKYISDYSDNISNETDLEESNENNDLIFIEKKDITNINIAINKNFIMLLSSFYVESRQPNVIISKLENKSYVLKSISYIKKGTPLKILHVNTSNVESFLYKGYTIDSIDFIENKKVYNYTGIYNKNTIKKYDLKYNSNKQSLLNKKLKLYKETISIPHKRSNILINAKYKNFNYNEIKTLELENKCK